MKNETGTRWMVVDNDSQALEAVASLLKTLTEVEVCPFESATEALNAFAAAPEAFNLVVTDFDMPKMNGVDFRRHLQALAPSLKVLLITGGGFFTPEYAVRSGFCGLLHKPFSLPALKIAIENTRKPTINRTELSAAI